MEALIEHLEPVDRALAAMVFLALVVAMATGRRGGRFRGLTGWSLFWVGFAVLLACLSHAPRWLGFLLLMALMFASLRAYFFVAPVRPTDRHAILATYVAIPLVLYPVYIGSEEMFLATVPALLFLLAPLFVAMGPHSQGLLDSIGRTLLGVIFFIFCTAHLGLLANLEVPLPPGADIGATSPGGLPELFGVLVLAADLVQRLLGRFRAGEGKLLSALGLVLSLLLVTALGFWLGPVCGLEQEDGARAAFMVGLAVFAGAVVGDAVAQGLDLRSSAARLGRGAFLDRTIPAVYAAPVFYHYLNHFVLA